MHPVVVDKPYKHYPPYQGRVWPWLQQRTEARFAAEGDDASGPWAELLEATNVFRRRQGFPPAHPINVRTGALRAYAMTKTIETQAGGVALSQPHKGGLRDTQVKFNHAQRGGQARPGGPVYPARPIVALADRDQWEITTRLMRWIIEGGTP